jgi:TolB-like protein/tetratricopeptide (TPR) repeat protein
MSIFSELKRRNVFRVAATYVVSAWLLIEIGNTLEETLNLPEWADTFVAFLLIIGFPIVVFFSWAYEITPEGIKREKDIDPADTSRSVTASKLNRALFLVMAIALAYFVVDEFYFERVQAPAAVVEQASTPSAVTASEGSPQEGPGETAPAIPDKSIAVLPFVNMSSDPEQEYFSDGLTEELLNLLAGIDDLKVAARTSSFFYKDKLNEVPMKEVARQLEVAHILEGSVRKGGDKIRITAQLIKADDGFHLWSETYDRTLDDVFAIQDEIAAAVVNQLKLTLLGDEVHQVVVDPKSYELSLQGRFLFNRRSEGDVDRAFELFEQALEIDPNNVMALVGISPLYIWLFDPPRFDDAIDVTNRALTIEPDNPDALARKASALYRSGREAEAEAVWDRALELGEKSALVPGMAAGQFFFRGDIEKGLEWSYRAISNDPLHLVNLGNTASNLFKMGRWQEAERLVRKMQELAPETSNVKELSAELLVAQGRPAEALAVLDKISTPKQRTPYNMTRALQIKVMAYHDLGRDEESRAALAEMTAQVGQVVQPDEIAVLHAYRGEADEAFEWIERSLEVVPSWGPGDFVRIEFVDLMDDPRWAMVRDHFPGYQGWDLLRR